MDALSAVGLIGSLVHAVTTAIARGASEREVLADARRVIDDWKRIDDDVDAAARGTGASAPR